MSDLATLISAHPLRKKPYNAIKFARLHPDGTPLYRVSRQTKEYGAENALRVAFELYGGHCFHCKKFMPAKQLSHACTRDHLRSRADGGGNILHNLVFACGPCNAGKGRQNLASFNVERGAEYLNALDEHITRCVRALQGVTVPAPATAPAVDASLRGHDGVGTDLATLPDLSTHVFSADAEGPHEPHWLAD